MTDTTMPGEPIAIPLPRDIDRDLGYSGDARFVAFYHSELGDDVVYMDGCGSGTGNTWAFSMYRNHRAVAPLLAEWNLGYSDAGAESALVLDREQNRASVAPLSEARAFLAAQWPEPEPLTPEQEELFQQELARLMEEHRNQPIDWEAITRQQREQQTRMAVMLAWLDQQVPPGQGESPPLP